MCERSFMPPVIAQCPYVPLAGLCSIDLHRLCSLKLHSKFSYAGFPLDLENLENLEKWEYAWKTWKYHGILNTWINIMEKWQYTWKNMVATKNSLLTPLKQYKIH